MEGVRKRGTGDGANGASAGGKRARGESGGARPFSGRKPSSSRTCASGISWVLSIEGLLGFDLFAMLGFRGFSGNRGKL